MNVEFENARAAWSWMVEHTQVERIGQVVDDLGSFCVMWERNRDGADLYKEAADGLATLVLASPGAHPAGARILARVWIWQVICSFGGDPKWNGALLQRSAALLEQAAAAGEDVR